MRDEDEVRENEEEQDLPKDEAGRLKIKKNYEELLGIRVEKLKGKVLNRERINKSMEGIYFICAECRKVCHSLDEGLIADPKNEVHLCLRCGKDKSRGEDNRQSKAEDKRRALVDVKDWLHAGNR
jgi:hypothetical protein